MTDRLPVSAARPDVDDQARPFGGPACGFAFGDHLWGQQWVEMKTLGKQIVVAVRCGDLQLPVGVLGDGEAGSGRGEVVHGVSWAGERLSRASEIQTDPSHRSR